MFQFLQNIFSKAFIPNNFQDNPKERSFIGGKNQGNSLFVLSV